MTTFERKLRTALRKLGIDSGSSVVVAVSGGADSSALLDGLVRMRNAQGRPGIIFAAHLNHRLRGEESDGDEQFVRQMMARLKVEHFIERVDVAEEARRLQANLEATARKLRYDFLRRCAESAGADYVMTAHSRDDQAETVLMWLMRGIGIHGLRGIHPVRPLGDHVILLRPMLAISRAEVVEHCERYGLIWRTDSSNYSIDMTRNRVRLELLPLMRSFNPRIEDTLALDAELMREDADCLDDLAVGLLGEARKDRRLDVETLISAHPSIRRRALRLWFQFHEVGIEGLVTAHIRAVDRLLSPGKSGKCVELPDGWVVTREFETLILRRSAGNAIPPACAVLPSALLSEGQSLTFGDFTLRMFRGVNQQSININRLKESGYFVTLLKESTSINEIQVRTRKSGDLYVPCGSRHRIKLKTLMIRHKIPISARDNYPVLVTDDDSIIWVPGLPAVARFSESERPAEPATLIVAIRRDSAPAETSDPLREIM